MKFDKQILRFFGYWDESDNPNGIIRDVEIYYFLADDTIEIKEILPKSLLKDYGTMHVKKTKIPKVRKALISTNKTNLCKFVSTIIWINFSVF